MKTNIFKIIGKNKISILFIFGVSILFCFSFFSESIYYGEGHDLTFHMYRLVGIKEALQDGQILPKIYPYANYGFGYATPLFYCDLFLYPFAILYYTGMPLVISYKIMVLFYTLLTTFNIYYVLRKIFNNSLITYCGSILYVFSTYRIYDVLVREALGETLALCFIPLLIYSWYRLFIRKDNNWMSLGICFSLLLFSHLISMVLYTFVFLIYIIFFMFMNKNDIKATKKMLNVVIKATIFALAITMWFWAPMLEQLLDQTFYVNNISNIYNLSDGIVPISSLLNVICKLDIQNGEQQLQNIINMGLPLLLCPMFYLFSKKNKYVSITIIICLILLASMFGLVPIYKIKALTFIQFLFRLYITIYPLLVFCYSYILKNINNKKILIYLCIFGCALSVLNICMISVQMINSTNQIDNYETREEIFSYTSKSKDYNEKELMGAEYLPNTEIVDYQEETPYIKEINSDGQYCDLIYEFNRNFTKFEITYDFEEDVLIMLPITYYKGYKAYEIDDGIIEELPIISVENYKQCGIEVCSGHHNIIIHYDGTIIQKLSLTISLMSIVVGMIINIKRGEIDRAN